MRIKWMFAFALLVVSVAAAAEEVAPLDLAKANQASQIADPQEATRAYLDAIPAERRAKTKSYAHGNYILDIVGFLYSVAIFVGLLATGLSVRMRNLAVRITRFRPLQTAGYWVQFVLVLTVLTFPLDFYRSFYRETQFGLLTQDFSGWIADQGKGLLLGCLFGSILMILLYGVLRRAARTWWIWGAAVMTAFVIFIVALSPVFIAPIFNKFTPIQNTEIRYSILEMARRYQIPADEVYEMDASTRTDRISAFVAGALGTTRIVMFDNTLRRCTPEEIQMIMGHEMGHYVLNHVWKGIAFFGVLILAGFLFMRWGFAYATRRWPSLSLESVYDLAGLPLLMLLLTSFLFVTGPLLSTWSRVHEDQADDFGLEASAQPDAAATTFLKLGEYRDLEPHPIIEALLYDHPSGRTRILNAMKWKAAHR